MAKTGPTPRTRLEARPRREQGAAAVEFALLVPLLFLILFGIIDYGLWFNDSLNVRQAIREGARQGVVQNYDPACTSGTELDKIACETASSIGAITPGAEYVRVEVPNGWVRGEPLIVCGIVVAQGLTGLSPLPADGLIKSETRMSIEVDIPAPTATTGGASSPPGGWAWCG